MPPEQARKRRPSLAERRDDMPIIDNAQAPWSALRRRTGNLLWLRILRPVVVALLWLVVVRYAWTHFFGLPDDLPLWQQITLYGVAVGAILLAMLLLAPIRRREVGREAGGMAAPSTLSDMSDYAQLPEEELAELQQVQRLVVHHDAHGQLRKVEGSAPRG